jgi:hypothetical protein
VKTLVLLLSLVAFGWSGTKLHNATDRDVIGRLGHVALTGETLSPAALERYQRLNVGDDSATCSADVAGSAAIIEASLAQRALREGSEAEYGVHYRRFVERTSAGLICSPHRPFYWFFRFAADAAAGAITENSLGDLVLSYCLVAF